MSIERTLVILKPDALRRRLAGEILARIERVGFRVVAARLARPPAEAFERHYRVETLAPVIGRKSREAGTDVGGDEVAYGRMVLGWTVAYMTGGPVLLLVLEGDDAIRRVRALVGATDPTRAAPGTIRGDLGRDGIASANRERRGAENLVHASDKDERAADPYAEADHEIALWFDDPALTNRRA
jgi:nucleoside-diphosphate kinase